LGRASRDVRRRMLFHGSIGFPARRAHFRAERAGSLLLGLSAGRWVAGRG
jgi:hypothetical protein